MSEESNPADRATTSAGVLSGGLWNGLTNLLPPVYALAQSVVAARILGPDGMGRQSFIAWSYLTLAILLAGGLPNALLRYVGYAIGQGRAAEARTLLAWAWRIEAVAAVLGGGLLVAVALTGSEPQAAWVFAGVACAASAMQAVPSALLTGVQRWKQASLIGLSTGTIGTVAVVVVLSLGGGIVGMFAVEAVVTTANLALAGIFARRALAELVPAAERGVGADLQREVLRYAAVASIQVLFHLVVWRRSEFFLLNRYSPDSAIAMYSIAFSTMWALERLPTGMTAALTPAFATLLGAGRLDRVRTGFARSVRLSLLAGLPMAAGLLAVGPSVLRAIYGGDYADAGVILQILAVVFPLVLLSRVAGSLLQGLGKLRLILTSGAVATLANVTLAVALIPRYGGMGAGIANAGAQATSALTNLFFVLRSIGRPPISGGPMARVAVAAVVTGGSAWFITGLVGGSGGAAAAVLWGTVVYTLATWVLRAAPPDDVAWLLEVGRRRVPQRVVRIVSRRWRL